ncbi:DUF58 domain-containing protein [Paenibacillus dokdonensis]|uniref:DUF58 domain-containing protein n=1 Tax=Paenibacillus dokdonensis TaxID=2567944 RepID=UPI0010A8ABE0|nr:DUF58 domain-containing protein [Paenibacillus dokdonensis]
MKKRLSEWTGGVVVLGLLAALYFWHGGASAFYMLLLAGLIITSGVLMQGLGPHRIIVKRHLSESVISAGDTAVMQVQVEFRSFLPVPWLAVEDYYTGGSSRQILFPGFRRNLAYSCELHSLPRGVYSFDACLLEWGGLFGWFKGGRMQRAEGRLLVLPKPLPIGNALELPTAVSKAAQQPIRMTEQRHGTKGPEVREYIHSDPLSRIHWKSSAKRGTLQTYMPEDERDPFCLVILDRSLQGYLSHSDPEETRQEKGKQSFEKAVSAASGILGEMMRTGARGSLVCGVPDMPANRLTATGGVEDNNRDAYTRMLASLSPVNLAEGPQLSSMLVESTKKMVPGTRVIIVTGMLDKQVADAAGRLMSQGMQVDFYCTAIYGNFRSPDESKRAKQAGSGSSFALAVHLSRMGAGVFAVNQELAVRIGLVDTSSQGEGAV